MTYEFADYGDQYYFSHPTLEAAKADAADVLGLPLNSWTQVDPTMWVNMYRDDCQIVAYVR